jgi:hypothetical protein
MCEGVVDLEDGGWDYVWNVSGRAYVTVLVEDDSVGDLAGETVGYAWEA